MTVWLKNNRRMLAAAAGMVGVWLCVGAAALVWGWLRGSTIALTVGSAVTAGAALGGIVTAFLWRTPRLACDGRHLHAYLRGATPIRIPLEIVECFLLGQGPSLLTGEKHAKTETATLVV